MRERAGLEAPAETQNPSTALGAFRHKNSLGMTGFILAAAYAADPNK